MGTFCTDTDSTLVREIYALVYAPRQKRKRFPENCVTQVDTETIALDQQNINQHLYAAKVLGPSRSSEGLMLYYLLEWIEA